MKMLCKRCGKKYERKYSFCPKCAVKLDRDHNRCSDPRSVHCERGLWEGEDIACGYCGSLTTYEKDRKDNLNRS